MSTKERNFKIVSKRNITTIETLKETLRSMEADKKMLSSNYRAQKSLPFCHVKNYKATGRDMSCGPCMYGVPTSSGGCTQYPCLPPIEYHSIGFKPGRPVTAYRNSDDLQKICRRHKFDVPTLFYRNTMDKEGRLLDEIKERQQKRVANRCLTYSLDT